MGWLEDHVLSPVQSVAQQGGGIAGLALGGGGIGALAGTLAGGGGGNLSNLLDPLTGAGATRDAIAAQTDATARANQVQADIYGKNQTMEQPWQQAGMNGLATLQSSMPDLTRQFTANDYHQSPGFQFQLDQGNQAIQRSAAAKGLLGSTGTLKSLDSYSQGLANQDFQQAVNNFTNNQQQRFGMLSGLTNYGQEANRQLSGAGQNYANQVGQNYMGLGNATASADIGSANRMSGLIGQGIGAAGYAAGRS